MVLIGINVKNNPLKNQIIRHLYFDKGRSCAELSELLDKSLPSTSKAINELIEEGLVVEDGYARSKGGRRPLVYSIKADAMYILTVAMDQFTTRIQLVDLLNHPAAEMVIHLRTNDMRCFFWGKLDRADVM